MLRRVFATLWIIAGLSGCGADSSIEATPAVRPARLITVGAGDHSAPSLFVGKVAPAHTVNWALKSTARYSSYPYRRGHWCRPAM